MMWGLYYCTYYCMMYIHIIYTEETTMSIISNNKYMHKKNGQLDRSCRIKIKRYLNGLTLCYT